MDSGDELIQTRPSERPHWPLLQLVRSDLRRKARWCYEEDSRGAMFKVLFSDGTFAMVVYRLMQWSRKHRLVPLEMIFNKLNSVFNHCIIGRGAEFGPGLVLIHAHGVVINGKVSGGSNIAIEHEVTIGAERRQSPRLGDGIFIGTGAKVIGPITIGDGARIGANAVVIEDVPPYGTAVGVPARVVRFHSPADCDEPSSGQGVALYNEEN